MAKKSKVIIYHNVRCSKSRCALELLEENGVEAEVIHYLETPPGKEELTELVRKLGITPEELVRKKEPVFLEKYKDKKLSPSQWIAAMVKHPELIERPVIVKGNKAVIGREAEKVLGIIGK